MLLDEEFQELMLTEERVKKLGFRPQSEILSNHLLPYADQLDEESTKFLAEVKTNLAKAILLREMKPACGVWSSRLMKYIKIYGLKFSKEDHISFTKLAYELVMLPELEPVKVRKFATLFIMLVKKKELLSPEDLVLPWRPLYDLGTRLFEKSSSQMGMFQVLSSMEATYTCMVNNAKPYFDVSATKEILDEIMPHAMRWGHEAPSISPLNILPVGLHPKYADQGHRLWFDQLMTLLDVCHNGQYGEPDIFILFATLAKRNPGAVDWAPHTPKMFMRFLHALNLPVSCKDMPYSRQLSMMFNVPQVAAICCKKDPLSFLNLLNLNLDDIKYVAKWIVWTINPDGVTLKHLKSFLAGVESYLHSANSGRWSFKLRDLLKKMSGEFLNRVRFERELVSRKSWENRTPKEYKLRDEDISEFVSIVLEPTFQSVYSRSGSLEVTVALQSLATLRPAMVIPPLIEKLQTSLTSLTEPHRVTAAMVAVAAVVRPMLRGADADYPEGPTHVVPLLMSVLPGIDPNDIRKTVLTLHFILVFSYMVTFIDCSSARETWSDLTEEELLTCESTAQFEDFVLVFLDKIFAFIESSVQEHVRLESTASDTTKSKLDSVMESAITACVGSVLAQCSPKIFKAALRKFKAFATETTYETNVSGCMIASILKMFARVDSEATLAAFLPQLCQELRELLASDEALSEENPPRDLVYRLVLLREVVSCDGTVLLKYMDQIVPVLDRALRLVATCALYPACATLDNILASLSAMNIKESKCLAMDYAAAPEKWLPIREWGNGYSYSNVDFQWRIPSAEEAACAQMLIDRYVKAEVIRLHQWMTGVRPMTRERRFRSLKIIYSAFACVKFLPPPNEEPIFLMESRVPATSIPFTNGVKHQVFMDGVNMRVAFTHILLDVQTKMLREKTEDPRGLKLLLQVWDRVIMGKHMRCCTLESKIRANGIIERVFDGKGGVGGKTRDKGAARLRTVLADAVRVQEDSRAELVCDAGIPQAVLAAMHAVYELSINGYSSIRRLAQVCLHRILKNYPFSYCSLVPRLVNELGSITDDDEGHARHKGVLNILLGPPRATALITKHDWATLRALWPAILRTRLSEKLSIHKLEFAFPESFYSTFQSINTRLTINDETVEVAKRFLTEDQLNDAEFLAQLANAKDSEKAFWDNQERIHLDLINQVVDIAESSNLEWWRLELVLHMLVNCTSIQTPFPPRAVRLFANCVVHENYLIRVNAQRLVLFALKQRKRKLKKIEVDPYEVAGVQRPNTIVPGYRKDLEWAMWSKDRELKTDEDWDRPWLRDQQCGFYSWPEKIKVAAPMSEQNFAYDTKPEDMEEGERYIYEFFTDEDNLAKLIKFNTTEVKKGKDKFNGIRCFMFRNLFAHFGPRITKRLTDEAMKCASSSEEYKQRFAAEIAFATLRAIRYWRREDAIAAQRDVVEIVTNGLTAVTPETIDDWAAFGTVFTKMDPVRSREILLPLLQLCSPSDQSAPDSDTSFVASARLRVLKTVLSSLSWQGAPLAVEILERLEAANLIQHPYENVRSIVGCCLMVIFNLEVVFPGGEASSSVPSLRRFLESLKPRLAALYDEQGDIVIQPTWWASSAGAERSQVAEPAAEAVKQHLRALLHALSDHVHAHTDAQALPSVSSKSELQQLIQTEENTPVEKDLTDRVQASLQLTESATPAHGHHEQAVNLLTTVLNGCMGVVLRGMNSDLEAQFTLVPLACALASRSSSQSHEEFARAAGGFLATLAQAHYQGETFDTALKVLEELADARSWSARLACLDFAIPLLFYGLPMLCERPERAVRAEAFALKLMKDSRVEVRQSAAKVLTGLMHCQALPDEDKTLKSLMRQCRSKELREKHCGVLGLCAYMSSRPYSLGPKLGAVLTELARHTNAPGPIPSTIRTALADFKRTHQDDWPKHRDQLTEEELDLLADLSSPPSYYA